MNTCGNDGAGEGVLTFIGLGFEGRPYKESWELWS